jgi:hypothetical protein
MNHTRRTTERSILLALLLSGLLVPACSTETLPTDPLDSASQPGRILGLVTGDDEPVSGVIVTLSRGGAEVATVTTTGNGEFGFTELDAGTYTVAIPEIDGMDCSRVRAATVAPGEAAVVSFACVSTPPPASLGRLEGRVTVNGVGVRGLVVSVSDASGRIAWRTTTNDGTYRFPPLPTGAKSVWIISQDPCPGTQQVDNRRQLEVSVSEGEVAVADFACTGQSITGRVTLDGIAVSGWSVLVCYGLPVWDYGCVGPFQPTDSEGRYAHVSLRQGPLGDFPPGDYVVLVESPFGTACPEPSTVRVPSGVMVTVNFACNTVPSSGGGADNWDY